jgi:hypothetical protein
MALACALILSALSRAWADTGAGRARLEAAAESGDDRTAAEALYQLGELDYAAMDFKSAVRDYQAAAARLPSARHTPRALSMIAELRLHSEGDYEPLRRLETVRRSTTLSNDPAAIDALVSDANGFPPGRVRVEARMLAAEAYAGRLGRKNDARPLLRLVAEDPQADSLMSREAATELFGSYLADTDYDAALALTHGYPKLLPQYAERDVKRLVRRKLYRVLAWGDVGLLVVLAAYGVSRVGARQALGRVGRLAPMAIAFAALCTGVGGFLASRYEQSSPFPFGAMLPVILGAILLARVGSAGGPYAPVTRGARAVVAFAAVFAVAFLMLDRMDPIYLQGFGI